MSKLRVNEITDLDGNLLWSGSEGVGGAPVSTASGDQTLAEALDSRVIYVGSVAELEGLSLDVGVNVYLTQDGRAGGFVVKTGTPPSDPQQGIYIVLANGNYAERANKKFVAIEMFGAAMDGTTDDTAAWQGMANVVEDGAVITSLSGNNTSICDGFITWERSVEFRFNQTEVNFYSGGFRFSGGRTTVTSQLTSAVSKGDYVINLDDTSTLSAGDLIAIHDTRIGSFSTARDYYQKGEFLRVSDVNAGAISLETPTRDSYIVDPAVVIHKFDPITLTISGITVRSEGSAPCGIENGENVRIINSKFYSNNGSLALSLGNCFNSSVDTSHCIQKAEVVGGQDYGLVLASCQNVSVNDCYLSAVRHGCTMGAGIGATFVCRDIFVTDSTTDSSGNALGSDIHGIAENCGYIDCTHLNGAAIGGKDVFVRGGSAVNRQGSGVANIFAAREIVGGVIEFSDVQCIVQNSNFSYLGRTDPGWTQHAEHNYEIIYKDISIDFRAGITAPDFLISANNAADGGKVTKWSFIAEGFRLTGDVPVFSGPILSFSNNLTGGFAVAPAMISKLIVDDFDGWEGSFDYIYRNAAIDPVDDSSYIRILPYYLEATVVIPAGGSKSGVVTATFPEYQHAPQFEIEQINYPYDDLTGSWSPMVFPSVRFVGVGSIQLAMTTAASSLPVVSEVSKDIRVKIFVDRFGK